MRSHAMTENLRIIDRRYEYLAMSNRAQQTGICFDYCYRVRTKQQLVMHCSCNGFAGCGMQLRFQQDSRRGLGVITN
jgi:hypothetical protein